MSIQFFCTGSGDLTPRQAELLVLAPEHHDNATYVGVGRGTAPHSAAYRWQPAPHPMRRVRGFSPAHRSCCFPLCVAGAVYSTTGTSVPE